MTISSPASARATSFERFVLASCMPTCAIARTIAKGALQCPWQGSRPPVANMARLMAVVSKPQGPATSRPPPGLEPVIEFRGVSKRYPGGDTGLDGATFSVGRGEFVFLIGQTGSGKSTVLRLL